MLPFSFHRARLPALRLTPILLSPRARVEISPPLSATMSTFQRFPAGAMSTGARGETCKQYTGPCTDSHPVHTPVNNGGACTARAVFASRSYRRSFLPPTDKQREDPDHNRNQTVFLALDEQNELRATSLCLFLGIIDSCRSTANVH